MNFFQWKFRMTGNLFSRKARIQQTLRYSQKILAMFSAFLFPPLFPPLFPSTAKVCFRYFLNRFIDFLF